MKDPPPKIAFPNFRSGLVLGLFTFKQNSLRVPRLRRAGSEKKKDYPFVNSIAESGFVSREIFFSKFLEGSARRLKRFWATFRVCRVEQAIRRLFDRVPSVAMHA